ncbi:hypothetical protein ACP_0033 [Acidobacterium capsulatum ATCC 51196]|uniref:Uncharacterized protein n=1 Tax=Acidobacterium capsulatum (strain ATCC 51196 / DSM 11244 / BCRC 80197 / JCM 7670 / NBRC 15755 / NCIMB 13165 / 161) TaxID=240015 RepID=C1F7Z0_ACIC5|nr:hypothetical protein ACP_0033 [Acidobacterium capsulatum ATCC 51196]
MFSKKLPEHSIESAEVARVFQPDAAPNDVLPFVSRFVENSHEILDCLPCLCRYISGHNFTVHHWNLTGNIKPAIGFYCS